MGMDITSGGYQNAYGMPKPSIKGRTFKPRTLEDLRDTTNKSCEVADMERLMEKYDPEAYAQYSKLKEQDSLSSGSYSRLHFMSKWEDKIKKGLKDGTISSDSIDHTAGSNESGLSAKAQDFLKNLRKQYGDYDFFVGGSGDDLKSLAKSGSKEFSIIFSNEELEKMANDADYAKEKLQSMEQAVKMSKQICEQFGQKRNGAEISKVGIVFNDDGTTSFFAELEKSSAKQRERLENKRAERREEEKKAGKELDRYAENRPDTKRAEVEADSLEELLKKMNGIDWDSIKAEKMPETGGRYDFTV